MWNQYRARFATFVLAILFSLRLSQAAVPTTGAADAIWGKAVNGLRARLSLFGGDPNDYHPGELLDLSGVVQNSSPSKVRVQSLGLPSFYVRFDIREPSGRETGSNFDLSKFPPDKPPFEKSLREVDPRGTECVYGDRFRLSGDLRRKGKYDMWFEYDVPPGNAGAWSGHLTSNHITITVSELPPEKRLQNPTEAQLDTLKELLGPGDPPAPRWGAINLDNEMLVTRNEGLAMHIVDLLKADHPNPRAKQLEFLLAERYGIWTGVDSAIDGPYLKAYAELCLQQIENGDWPRNSGFAGGGGFSAYPDMSAILAFLHFHPEKSNLKDRVLKLASQSAKRENFERARTEVERSINNPSERPKRPPFLDLWTAWNILLDAQIFHDGMSLQDAIAILGMPSDQRGGSVEWGFTCHPGNENPGIITLTAKVMDEKFSEFRLHAS